MTSSSSPTTSPYPLSPVDVVAKTALERPEDESRASPAFDEVIAYLNGIADTMASLTHPARWMASDDVGQRDELAERRPGRGALVEAPRESVFTRRPSGLRRDPDGECHSEVRMRVVQQTQDDRQDRTGSDRSK
jgi:hypothetical protein